MPVRPLFPALLLSLAAGSAHGQRAPAVPAACTDFYGHVNAAWLAQHPLPAGSRHYSRWDQLIALGQTRRNELLAATHAPEGKPASALLADLIASSQDEEAIEAAGTRALQPLLQKIERIRRNRDVPAVVAELHAAGVPVLFAFQVRRDAQGRPYAWIGPGGLGLPDPSFHLSAAPEVQALVRQYRDALSEWLRLSGVPARELAAAVDGALAMELELARAAAQAAPATLFPLEEAQKVVGALDLPAFLAAQGLKATHVELAGPAFFQVLDRQLARAKPAQWRAYLRAQVSRELAPTLPNAWRRPWAELYQVRLGGQTEPEPRALWFRRMLETEAPELLDLAYDERWLPSERQQRAERIAAGVRAAALAAVDRADWLSDEGKAKARRRLETMEIQLGRQVPPDTFGPTRFSRADFAGNVLALRRGLHQALLQRARRAWPAEQWHPLLAWIPGENRLVATTAVMQPPVLGEAAGPGDYGAFGALLAQQIGIALQQWEGADAQAWAKRTQPLIGQYNAYSATGGATRVNGVGSHAQNQADLAGLELAWEALNASGPVDSAAARAFFTGWAALWPRQDEALALAQAQATATHAPARWRVNGPLANLPAFGQAFGCAGRAAMLRPAREQVALWR
ncbi:M13-type metalloendopeptidase [Arenimonas fontis]|uniref:M13 family metallopeptidase n=1 Tax=Arenimonas fontis TaxID=2608255 RepID=A0A5B2ZD25_9GAMM|nr:M13 family metallopeptidase [Arenimonas fontis]KAA2285825.1 M13 family metallopeptidase [Arenimonas fontis]